MEMRNLILFLTIIICCQFSLSPFIVELTESSTQADTLNVIYPHSSDFADYVFMDFESWYQAKFGIAISVQGTQLDSTAGEEQVAQWNGTNPEADIIWGGGAYNFELLRNNPGINLLEPHQVSEHANYLASFGGWDLYEPQSGTPSWYAAAISGYGFMYNTQYLATHNLPIPHIWQDLTNYTYFGHIVMADPGVSGPTSATINQILQYENTDNGKSTITVSSNMTEAWRFWAKVTGNVGQWATSSSQVPIKVANGDFGIGIVIDYYSWEQSEAGYPVVFTYGGATTVSPEPVAIIHNAPHLSQAKSFMDYITSTRGQSRVGKYRTPANYQATTPADGPIKRAFFSDGTPDVSSFPIIRPYSSNIDGMLFSRARTLFSKWFVVNTIAQKAAWDAIWKTNETLRKESLNLYLTFPTGLDGTIENLLAQDYHSTSITDGWSSDGAVNFESAKSKALEGISSNLTGSETTSSSSQTITTNQTPGFEFYFMILIPITIVFVKRKKFIYRK